ncbi:MAG: allantoinase AllB [Cyanobacteriota bacterium]
MNFDLAIKSKKILTPNGFFDGYVLIKNGKIAEITDKKENLNCPIDDVGDLVLMYGIVDSHVHINEPGRTDWEGFETATKSAAAGGITTLVDMPLNCSPVTTTAKALKTKLDAVVGKLWVDCGFWGGIIPNNILELEPLIKAGVMGCKVFLIDSGIEEFPNVTESDLRDAMPILKKYNLPLLVHAEMESVVGETNEYNNAKSYQAFLDSRPKSLENNAIDLVLNLCNENRCKTHIVHLSSADSLDIIQKAKDSGIPFSVETCPHYLTFNSEDISDGDTRFKCCPPIREKENNEKLWDGIKNEVIDFIVSDHSPCTANLKLMETGNIEKAWGGISGLQFSLSIIWTEAKNRGISINQLSKLMSEKTANFIGLGDVKGKIAIGYDADFVIWNPGETFTIKEDIIQHKNKVTPYLDKELTGVVKKTYLRGNKIYENGTFLDNPIGEFLLKKND